MDCHKGIIEGLQKLCSTDKGTRFYYKRFSVYKRERVSIVLTLFYIIELQGKVM